jgi:putative ABC transport system substrate-binding protein
MTRKITICILTTFFLVTTSLAAEAQQPTKMPRIGYLTSAAAAIALPNREAFLEGLRQLGYVEGKNIIIEWRYAEGRSERLSELAAELVNLNVDVIVTASTPAIRAVHQATKAIPIVMANVGDPVAQGFITSLARPGGNVTGLTNLSPDVSTKRLELLKEVSPKVFRVAVFSNAPQHGPAMRNMETAAQSLRVQLLRPEVRVPDDLERAFEMVTRERADALVTMPNPLLRLDNSARVRVATFIFKRRMPSIHEGQEYVHAGGLMSYGPNESSNYRRAAIYVDKILKGAKVADLPVEQPMKFEFVVNLKTAKQIGLTIPPNVLARADKVIR